MKKLYYEEGPLVMGCGIAGDFRIGEPKEVADDLAVELLRKGRLKEWQEPSGHDRLSAGNGDTLPKKVSPVPKAEVSAPETKKAKEA
jgi:hypothetical protein